MAQRLCSLSIPTWLVTLVTLSIFFCVNGELLHNASQKTRNGIMSRRSIGRMKANVPRKSYTAKKTSNRRYDDDSTQDRSSNLCPCNLNSAQGTICYDFMNQAAGTCRMRPCTDGFVCTGRRYATHYCFEKTKYVTKVISIGGGRCEMKKEWLTFRVPYVDIVQKGDEREKELNYNTLIRDDVSDLEPDACVA